MRRGAGIAWLVVAVIGAASCTVGPDYQRPSAPVPAVYKTEIKPPRGWKPAAASVAPVPPGRWWQILRDPVLDGLAAQIAVSNQNLKASAAAYRRALAVVEQTRAGFFPTITVNGSGERSGPFGTTTTTTGGGTGGSTSGTGGGGSSSSGGSRSSGRTQNNFSIGLGGSWALDLWGRLRRTEEGNLASAEASAADLAAARLSAETALATAYVRLRIADQQRRLLEATAKAYGKSLEIARNRHNAGLGTLADVYSAETQLRSTEAQAIAVGVDRAAQEDAIAALIGKPPAEVRIAPTPLVPAVPVIPAGVPSALLERRPDIAAAERQMAAANAQIGVAEAAYYPDLTLTASITSAATQLASLAQAASTIWAFGAQAAATLFDAGARDAEVAAAQAGFEQTVATYRQTVLTAFQQVEDQLAALAILERQAAVLADAVRLARAAVELNLNQYQAGTVAYTSVLTAQTALLSNELSALAVAQSRLVAAIALIEALGGGWTIGHP